MTQVLSILAWALVPKARALLAYMQVAVQVVAVGTFSSVQVLRVPVKAIPLVALPL